MPIYMDMHQDLGDVTEDDIRQAHIRDLELQEKHGVRFLTYWFNSLGRGASRPTAEIAAR